MIRLWSMAADGSAMSTWVSVGAWCAALCRANRGDRLTPCGCFQVKDVNVIIPATPWTVTLWQESNMLHKSLNINGSFFFF